MGFSIKSAGHINFVIDYLSEKWGEDIPKFNAFVLTRETECLDYTGAHALPKRTGKQQRPQEVAAHAAKIAAYPNWDKVVEYLKREAFEVAE